jgi:hypothetical protein
MWKPWRWARGSHAAALDNARAAATELNRQRVERDAVELYLAERAAVVRLTPRQA